ncbi:MAG: hypothetical protein JWR02_2871 [Mucilaginibacter sp.]|nr:hypothetical protein [Mucilaginibacter sp.]
MKYFLFILVFAGVCSCKTKSSPAQVNKAKLEQLADRSCRATSIREQRYALADKIRFTQDSLSKTKNRAGSQSLQSRLNGYLKQKEILLKTSLALADTIRMQLDSLLPYSDKAAQKRFTASLDSILKSKGCDR